MLVAYAWFFWEHEVRLLPYLCSRTKKSLDIGANRGIYAYLMRRYSASCDAFEPNPQLCGDMRKALGDRVDVHAVALSNRRGRAQLTIPLIRGREIDTSAAIDKAPEAFRSEWASFEDVHVTEVPMRMLDDFCFTDVGCIKIDVEGHELAVLQGGRKLLDRETPNLIVEIEERHRRDALRTVQMFLEDLGYSGFFMMAGRLHSIATFSPQQHQDLHRKPYVNNFIFLHRNTPRPWFARFL
jgi:FkbM family methyltransferase